MSAQNNITLYQFELSPFCDKIRRIMNFKNQTFEVENVTVLQTITGSIKKKNPAGKLPYIVHNGNVVSDSTDIAYYLEAQFPENPLIPSDPKDRALVHFFEDWADESLYFFEVKLRLTIPHNARYWLADAAKHDAAWVKSVMQWVGPLQFSQIVNAQGIGRKSLDAILDDLERHIVSLDAWLAGGDWLVAGQLTLADIAVYAQLFCVQGAQEGQDILRKYPAVTDWMSRVEQKTA